jgi:IclR family pca regulon transcriptional regulator
MAASPAPNPPLTRARARQLKSTVQSLAKGFRVLECFSDEQAEMTLSEIAAAARLDPGTTHRMLNTLVALGYVDPVPDSRRFALSLKVLDLGFRAIGRQDLRAIVRPVLRSLVGETNEAASFGVLEGGNVLFIERVRAGVTRLGADIRVGTSVPAQFSVIGIAILAFLPSVAFKRVMAAARQLTSPEVAGIKRAKLASMLDGVRKQGYILHDSLTSDGLRILAVPVRDPDGYPIGAISIAAPSFRLSAEELKGLSLKPLRAAAQRVGRALEASGSTN